MSKLKSYRLVVISLIFYLIGIFTYAFYIYFTERSEVYRQIDRDLLRAAESIKYLLPANYHDRAIHKDSIPSYEFYEHVYKLSKHANNYNVKYVYTLIKSGNRMVFTSSSATDEELSTGINFTKYWDEYTEASQIYYDAIDFDKPAFTTEQDRWGHFRSVILPIKTSQNRVYLAGADIEVSVVESLLYTKLISALLGGIFLLFISFPLVLFIRQSFKKRSNELKKTVEEQTNNLKIEILKRNQTDEILKYSEEKFSRAFEKSPLIMFITEFISGTVIEANNKFIETTGYKRKDVVGSFILTIPFFSSASDYEYIKKIIDEKSYINSLEINFKSNNQQRIGLIFAELLQIKNRKHILYIVHDITKNKELEREVINAKDKAEMSDKLKSAFLANMSHEIRTPLNSILGFAQLLKNEDLSNDKRAEFLDIIYSNGNNLLGIISDIIDFSKIEAGQLRISFNDFNLNALMNKTFNVFANELKSKNKNEIDLILDMPNSSQEFFTRSDEIRLSQVIFNLLSNAVKFTDKGSIRMGFELKGDFIHFFVKDTGMGIPPDKLEVVFDRFKQLIANNTRQYGGTGLGLSISKALVELMGGQIWVESIVGEGSSFYFTIPNRKPNDIPNNNNLPELTLKVKPLEGIHVLMADDDKSSLVLLNHILSKAGARVYSADNGVKALQLIQENPAIQVALLDINMPEMDGFEAMKQVKLLNPSVKVIFQTALAMIEDRKKIELSGCDSYIFKPVKRDELIVKILEVINEESPLSK